MSIAEHYDTTPRQPRCKVCDWFNQLDDEDKAFVTSKATGDMTRLHAACKTATGLEAEITSFRRHFKNHVD